MKFAFYRIVVEIKTKLENFVLVFSFFSFLCYLFYSVVYFFSFQVLGFRSGVDEFHMYLK